MNREPTYTSAAKEAEKRQGDIRARTASLNQNKDGSVLADSISGAYSSPRGQEGGREEVGLGLEDGEGGGWMLAVDNATPSFALIRTNGFLPPSIGRALGDANYPARPRGGWGGGDWASRHQWRVIIFGNNQYWIVKPWDKVS